MVGAVVVEVEDEEEEKEEEEGENSMKYFTELLEIAYSINGNYVNSYLLFFAKYGSVHLFTKQR